MKLADVDEGALGIELAAGSVGRVERVHRAHVPVPVLQLRCLVCYTIYTVIQEQLLVAVTVLGKPKKRQCKRLSLIVIE